MCGQGDHPPYDDNNGYGHLGDGVSGRTGDPGPDCPCGHMSDEHDLRGQTYESYDCLACARDHRDGEHSHEPQLAGCCAECPPPMSEQMRSLMKRYGLPDGSTEQQLLVALRDDMDRECLEPGEEPTPLSVAEVWLDQALEAEYQRLESR